MSYYEDIDEALAEYDGESDDEGLFSRKRRGRRQQRGGYAPAAPARGAVSQSQWVRSMDRVGEDVQDTASAIRKLQADQQNFAQMSMLMPLLLKGPTANVNDVDGKPVKVAVQSDSILPLMLPMMMMGGMGQSSGTSTSPGGGNNMMMMMMMMMMVLMPGADGRPRI